LSAVQDLDFQSTVYEILTVNLILDDTNVFRGRKVYDLITLVSEVSGLADIFFTTVTFLFGIFYTPLLLEAALHEHIGEFIAPKNVGKPKVKLTTKTRLNDVLKEVSSRFALKLNIWLIIASKVLPVRCRSPRTNKLFGLMD
jgi:hypothetical protein